MGVILKTHALKPLAAAVLSASCTLVLVHLDQGVCIGGTQADAPIRNIESKNWLPEGCTHDFGSHPRGTVVKHSFRIVNAGDKPIEMISARTSVGATRATIAIKALDPRQETKLDVTMDTNRFLGRKTQAIFVDARTIDGDLSQFRFVVTCESTQPLPEPSNNP